MSYLFGEDDECRIRQQYQGPDFFKFLPKLLAILKKEKDTVEFWNGCFNSNKITLEKLSKEETVIKLVSENATSYICKDSYLITTSNFQQFKIRFMKGESTYSFTNLTDDDIKDISVNGFRIFGFCEDLTKTISSIFKTIILFGDKGSGLLPYPINNEEEVMDFLRRYTDYNIEYRDPKYQDLILDIDENLIQTGDFFPVYKPCGLSSLIMHTSGSHASHSCVAFRIDGELFILESEEDGVIKTRYKEWVKRYKNNGYMISWLPLKEEYRKMFNAEKALEFYKSIEGQAFGYYNIFFTGFDNAKANLPGYLDSEILLLISSLMEKFDDKVINKYLIKGLNKRLNSNFRTIHEIASEGARRGQLFEELLATPERDEWLYDNGYNYVCSALVTGIYKAAGLFGDMKINAKEFTPRDIYQLVLIDNDFKDKRPQVCKDADPDLDFCQITGKYAMNFNKVSTIKPYDNMFERCECVAPTYERKDGC